MGKLFFGDHLKPCLLIPVYNHEQPLAGLVARLAPLGLDCFLIDDGSRESCAAVMRELATAYPWLRYVRRDRNGGKGSAVKLGLRQAAAAGFTHALQIDADGQHDPGDAGQFLALAAERPEAMITGLPSFDESMPKGRYYGRYLTHVWVWINTLSFTIRDAMCGYRVYPLAECLALLDAAPLGDRMDFDIEILVRLHWRGVPILSIPVAVRYPEDGVSHFRAWEDNVLISRMHARLFLGMLKRLPMLILRRRPAAEASDTHWAALEETGVVWGMKTLVWIDRHFGRTAFRLFLYPVISYYFLTNAKARAASRQYLRRVGQYFPELGLTGGWRDSYRHFLAFGESILDKLVVWLDRLDPERVEFPNRPLLVDLLNQGKGAILLGGHIGNLETCRALAELRGYIHLNILVHTKNAEKFNRLLGKLERGGHIELIEVTELNPATAIRLQEKLQRGEFLVLVGDRIPVNNPGRTVRADFLGEAAPFSQGPYLLASLLDCPVYTLFSYPVDGKFHIHLAPFAESIRIPRRPPARELALADWAGRYAACLEEHCRRVPLQWFNFFDFWKQPGAATAPPTSGGEAP